MEYVYRSVRITKAQDEKWSSIANQMGTNKNALLGMALDGMEIESKPSVRIELKSKPKTISVGERKRRLDDCIIAN